MTTTNTPVWNLKPVVTPSFALHDFNPGDLLRVDTLRSSYEIQVIDPSAGIFRFRGEATPDEIKGNLRLIGPTISPCQSLREPADSRYPGSLLKNQGIVYVDLATGTSRIRRNLVQDVCCIDNRPLGRGSRTA